MVRLLGLLSYHQGSNPCEGALLGGGGWGEVGGEPLQLKKKKKKEVHKPGPRITVSG